ncbi:MULTISPECIES: hypothetical protein [Kribbella]|uniref:Uncharacterized protein n=1 Tax=Kribbella ginsengisoli TaxID=363865 RepID=A0ABP6Y2K3_9ACTN
MRFFRSRRIVGAVAAAGLSLGLVAAGSGQAWAAYSGFGWESGGVQGWAVDWDGTSISSSTTYKFAGTRSLKLPQTGEQYAGYRSGSDLTGIGVGSVVTFKMYLPASANHPIEAKGYVTDGNNGSFIERFGQHIVLTPGAWNTFTLTIPAVTSIEGIGVEVDNPGWTGAVYLDAVSWTAP